MVTTRKMTVHQVASPGYARVSPAAGITDWSQMIRNHFIPGQISTEPNLGGGAFLDSITVAITY